MAKILITEDERLIAEELKLILHKDQHTTVGNVDSGEEAIEKAEALKPDLIFIDIQLKGKLDGLQTAQIILKNSKIPVIFCSAYKDDVTLARATKISPHGILDKPVEDEDVLNTVQNMLNSFYAKKIC